jgi:hypothetical protein
VSPHCDTSTSNINAASASLEYIGAAARAATASRCWSSGLPASFSIAAAIAAGFSGGTQTPQSIMRTMPVASPSGNEVGSAVPKVLEDLLHDLIGLRDSINRVLGRSGLSFGSTTITSLPKYSG